MESLLQTARRGDLRLLTERLKGASRNIHSTSRGGQTLTLTDCLIDEALYYARRGDLDEATLRLRLRGEPKFSSSAECEEAYAAAMADKRARASA